jgi:DNA invertase Pin-like site-specific DNA recombinase
MYNYYKIKSLEGTIMAIFGYLRVSTALQASEGESLEIQFRQIESYAVLKGFQIPPENFITERGVSGSLEFERRPEGGRIFK